MKNETLVQRQFIHFFFTAITVEDAQEEKDFCGAAGPYHRFRQLAGSSPSTEKRGISCRVSLMTSRCRSNTHSGRERRRIFISQTRAAPFFPVRENVTVLRTVCVRPRSKQVERIKESLFFCLFRGRRKRNSPCCSNTRQLPFIPLVGAPPPPCP